MNQPTEKKKNEVGCFALELELLRAMQMKKDGKIDNMRKHIEDFLSTHDSPPHFGGDGSSPTDYENSWGILTDYAGKVVLDIGCDSGSSSLFFLSKGAKTVHAIEADEDMYDRLLELEEEHDIIALNMNVCSADDFAGLIEATRPDLLKCDIDGFEWYFLDVPHDIIRQVPEYIFELHSINFMVDDRERLMLGEGFTETIPLLLMYEKFRNLFRELGYIEHSYNDDYCIVVHFVKKIPEYCAYDANIEPCKSKCKNRFLNCPWEPENSLCHGDIVDKDGNKTGDTFTARRGTIWGE